MDIAYKDYIISDDKQRISIPTVIDFLATSYWANRRPPERIKKSIDNSICYGVYHGDKMVAFARVVTDGAVFYYLCDVFVLVEYRGQGIAKQLVEVITSAPQFEWMTGVLGTADAHDLYKKYGFEHDKERFMRRLPQARK